MDTMKTIKTKVGETTIYAINDFTEVQVASEFFPSVTERQWEKFQLIYENRISEDFILTPFTYFCYIIQDGPHTILVDAGVGGGAEEGKNYSPDWKGRLVPELLKAGIQTQDVTEVVFTHFHADHIGWATTLINGEYEKTFPNARYIAQRDDYDAYHEGVTAGAFPTGCFDVCVEALYERGQLELIDVDRLVLTDCVTLDKKPGHTPGSMCVIVQSEGEIAALVGDCLANPLQVTEPKQDYVWDIDKIQAAQAKKDILTLYGSDGALIGGCHFGIGRIEEKKGKKYWKELNDTEGK